MLDDVGTPSPIPRVRSHSPELASLLERIAKEGLDHVVEATGASRRERALLEMIVSFPGLFPEGEGALARLRAKPSRAAVAVRTYSVRPGERPRASVDEVTRAGGCGCGSSAPPSAEEQP